MVDDRDYDQDVSHLWNNIFRFKCWCINILIGIFPTFGTTILWLDEAMRTIEQWEPMKSNDQGVFQWGLSVFGSHQRHDDHRAQSQYCDNRLPVKDFDQGMEKMSYMQSASAGGFYKCLSTVCFHMAIFTVLRISNEYHKYYLPITRPAKLKNDYSPFWNSKLKSKQGWFDLLIACRSWNCLFTKVAIG